jgi:phage recombination protein Bet
MATQTQTRQQSAQDGQQQQSNRPATLEPSRLPISAAVAKEFEIGPTEWRVLVDQLYPSARTVEAIMMALAYCRQRKLDIFKKPVHIVPMWSSVKGEMVETVWPGIAEIRTTAARTGQYAGIDAVEFGPMIDRQFEGEIERWENRQKVKVTIKKTVRFPEWASVIVYRMIAGAKCAFHAKVFWEETYASVGKTDLPNDMWNKRPRGQLDKCVEAAGLRKAFPEELGNIYAAEEMEGRTIDHDIGERQAPAAPKPQAPRPPRPAQPATGEQPRNEAPGDAGGVTIDGEVIDDDSAGQDNGGDSDAKRAADFAFFDELRERLATATDLASAEEIWTELDPMSRFEGDDDNQRLCLNIKSRIVQQFDDEKGE